jgi:hypothetical protein
MWARIHLTPLLQAEEDRDMVRKYWADQDREKQLLGTNTKVYNSDRYVCLVLRLDFMLTCAQICKTNIRGHTRDSHEIMAEAIGQSLYIYLSAMSNFKSSLPFNIFDHYNGSQTP